MAREALPPLGDTISHVSALLVFPANRHVNAFGPLPPTIGISKPLRRALSQSVSRCDQLGMPVEPFLQLSLDPAELVAYRIVASQSMQLVLQSAKGVAKALRRILAEMSDLRCARVATGRHRHRGSSARTGRETVDLHPRPCKPKAAPSLVSGMLLLGKLCVDPHRSSSVSRCINNMSDYNLFAPPECGLPYQQAC